MPACFYPDSCKRNLVTFYDTQLIDIFLCQHTIRTSKLIQRKRDTALEDNLDIYRWYFYSECHKLEFMVERRNVNGLCDISVL